MGQKILLSALIVAALLIPAPATAGEWPNDMSEPVTHPVLRVSSPSEVKTDQLSPMTFKMLRNLDARAGNIKFRRDDMREAEVQACQNLKAFVVGKTPTEIRKLIGGPSIKTIPTDDIWFYFFGYANLCEKLTFKDGMCATCEFAKSDDGDEMDKLIKEMAKFSIGKTEKQIEELFGEKLNSHHSPDFVRMNKERDEKYLRLGEHDCLDFDFKNGVCESTSQGICF